VADALEAVLEELVQPLEYCLRGSEEGSYLRLIDLCITQL